MISEDLSKIMGLISGNSQAMDIVGKMNPLDVVAVFVKDLSIKPKSAAQAALDLIRQIHDVHYEGFTVGRSCEPMQYPVPPSSRKGIKVKISLDGEEEVVDEAFPGPEPLSKNHVPHAPRPEAGVWPYDGLTVQAMSGKNRGRSKAFSLESFFGYGPSRKGVKTGMGQGAPSSIRGSSGDGNQAGTGSSWSRAGVPGWSRALGEFDPPDELHPPDEANLPEWVEDDEEKPSFMKPAPVGSAIPNLGTHGGRSPGPSRVGRKLKWP